MPHAKTIEAAGLSTPEQKAQWVALERAAIGAGVIQSALSGKFPSETSLPCPALRIRRDGAIEPLIEIGGAMSPLFEKWPNKFGKLAFGFVADHLESSAPDLLKELRSRGEEFIVGPFSMPIRPGVGFEKGAEPSKKGASALLALCKRMAETPDWLMRELEKMERQALEAEARGAVPSQQETKEPFLDRATVHKVK